MYFGSPIEIANHLSFFHHMFFMSFFNGTLAIFVAPSKQSLMIRHLTKIHGNFTKKTHDEKPIGSFNQEYRGFNQPQGG